MQQKYCHADVSLSLNLQWLLIKYSWHDTVLKSYRTCLANVLLVISRACVWIMSWVRLFSWQSPFLVVPTDFFLGYSPERLRLSTPSVS